MSKNKQYITLNPIKEIIFSISFSDDIEINCLNKFIELQEIKKAFPTIKPGYKANIKNLNDDKPPVSNVHKAGYILKCDEPCNRILQAKLGLFAFHKTKEYETFRNLMSELSHYWSLFQSCTGKLKVTNVSLRYLNFIEIEENENIRDYLKIDVSSPFGPYLNEFIHLKFKIENDQNSDATIVVTKGKDGQKKGIILDIILNKNFDKQIFDLIEFAFEGMREIKNDIFQKAIKVKTKKKYNL